MNNWLIGSIVVLSKRDNKSIKKKSGKVRPAKRK